MEHKLVEAFKNNIAQLNLFTANQRLLIAVSGGIDSVVLCELCFLLQQPFAIAHCNFQLRRDESEDDEIFVRSLGESYGVECRVKKFDTTAYASENKISIQVAARTLRYTWFNEILNTDQQFSFIATAHHADDNIETVLMNFYKGTGISGMRGILPKKDKLIRPLLFARKDDIVDFSKSRQLLYREDSSNLSDKYSRNYLRHNIIPLIKELYPEADKNMLANINRFRETEVLYTQAVTAQKKRLLELRNHEVHIPVLKLQKTNPLKTIIYEIAKDYGFSPAQVKEIEMLLTADTGKFVASATHRILKNRNWLIISPLQIEKSLIRVIEKDAMQVFFEEGMLNFKQKKISEGGKPAFSNDRNIAAFDLKNIRFPLILRKWQLGDYFYPLGMAKKKKLSRFFIDQKLSLLEKEKVWVLEMNKKIIWVINYRIDDRFKIEEDTREIIQIEFEALKV